MAHSAIMSVRITGNSDDAVKAFQKATSKAAAFGSFMGGAALKGVTALWNKLSGLGSAVMDMSDSTDKFVQTMNFAGIDTSNVQKASQAARDYADRTVYDLGTIQFQSTLSVRRATVQLDIFVHFLRRKPAAWL